jgi:hypothetical protein
MKYMPQRPMKFQVQTQTPTQALYEQQRFGWKFALELVCGLLEIIECFF